MPCLSALPALFPWGWGCGGISHGKAQDVTLGPLEETGTRPRPGLLARVHCPVIRAPQEHGSTSTVECCLGVACGDRSQVETGLTWAGPCRVLEVTHARTGSEVTHAPLRELPKDYNAATQQAAFSLGASLGPVHPSPFLLGQAPEPHVCFHPSAFRFSVLFFICLAPLVPHGRQLA